MSNERIFAIDPGPERSAYVQYDASVRCVMEHDIVPNPSLLDLLRSVRLALWSLVVEGFSSYGKPVGEETFATCVWSGRFMEAWDSGRVGRPSALMYRRDVKRVLCGTDLGVSDAVIRQRLIDIFGPGKEKAIGVKKSPGPLYGLKADEWQALAVAVAFASRNGNREPTP